MIIQLVLDACRRSQGVSLFDMDQNLVIRQSLKREASKGNDFKEKNTETPYV